ncbi:MAG TPA: CRISPR-associated endonuclease Cas1 [Gaiellaceae bacterium]|nr:CRISPR-associated endonuclease Cas1 [Gaiellaceae bacterium]
MIDDAPRAVPDLVPVRMLNEFVYCPRLFFLEWVEGLWDENADTATGTLAHERSDRGGGRLPAAEDADESSWSGEARSVTLDAPRIGMVAKIDLVEGADGSVSPIDHKKGRPRADGTAWDPERLQLAAQMLVLRENGYRCERGYLSFRETRTRVVVELDGELENDVRRTLGELRTAAIGTTPPPPLVDSPKCPRCSLVGICLPDETNTLRLARSRRTPVRRLLPTRPDVAPLYVQEPGSVVRLSRGRIEVHKDGERVTSMRLVDVLEVALLGGASISGPALRELAGAGVPVTHFTHGGRFQALTIGFETSNVDLRIAQFRTADDRQAALDLARQFLGAKIRNARVLLRRNGGEETHDAVGELMRHARRANHAPVVETLLGIEGAAAREYYRAFATLLRGRAGGRGGIDFDFERRSRRPPRDRANAVLSFLYALLTKECALAARRVGFDPLLGFYHRPRFGRPALALDLMEELRPLVADSVLLTLVNGGRLSREDFQERGGAVLLTSAGRKAVISTYEQRLATELVHPTFGYRVTYRRAIELQARLLAASLLGDTPAYRPLITR